MHIAALCSECLLKKSSVSTTLEYQTRKTRVFTLLVTHSISSGGRHKHSSGLYRSLVMTSGANSLNYNHPMPVALRGLDVLQLISWSTRRWPVWRRAEPKSFSGNLCCCCLRNMWSIRFERGEEVRLGWEVNWILSIYIKKWHNCPLQKNH